MMRKRLAQLSLIVPALLLYGCGSTHSPGDGRSGTATARTGNKPAAATTNDSIDADMVAAVSAGGTGPPIGVKFRLETRPVVGSPAQLVLALLPTPGLPISHIHASLQTEEGLQLQSSHTFDIDDPQDGATLAQDITVVPQHDGVLSLTAVVVVDYNATSVARTYVIPLIASAS